MLAGSPIRLYTGLMWLTCGVLPYGCTPRQAEQATDEAETARTQRVIALAPNAAEIICGLGAGDLLVGVSRFCLYPPELAAVPKIGGLRDPDLETVLALKPDLFILRGRSEPLEQLCRDHGIGVYHDRVETMDDLYVTIAELGRLVGREDQARDMIGNIRAELRRVEELAAGYHPVDVLLTIRSPTALTNVLTVGRDTFINELIIVAGGRNVFGGLEIRYPSVSLEEIVAAAPEVIIEVMIGEDLDAAARQALLEQWRPLAPIPAVANGRVVFVTEPYFTIPSQRVTLIAQRLLNILHPEIDPDA